MLRVTDSKVQQHLLHESNEVNRSSIQLCSYIYEKSTNLTDVTFFCCENIDGRV